MSPVDVIAAALADGVTLRLDAGKLKYSGAEAAVNRWLPAIREQKPAIIKALLENNACAGDLEAIRKWLAFIGERDAVTVVAALAQCRNDPSALAYYLTRAAEVPHSSAADTRMGKAIDQLHGDPGLRYSVEGHHDVDPEAVILSLAIRGKGACEIRIPKSRYDAFALLELIERHTRATLQ